MRVGVLMLPTDPWPEMVARAQRLEAMGYDHLWTYDHLSWRRYREKPWFGAMPLLTGIAAATSRVRLGPMVASPNFRHPLPFAKEAMTLDHVSAGRFVLGIGAGGPGFDGTVLGGQQPTPGERAARFAEFVEVVDGALRTDAYSYAGEYYSVDDARMLPGCVQRPRLPLALAATGRRTMGVVARHADAWIGFGDDVAGQLERLRTACAEADRDFADLELILMVDEVAERPLVSVEAFRDFVGRHAALGFTDIVFHHPRPDDPVWTEPAVIVEQIAVDVLPELHS